MPTTSRSEDAIATAGAIAVLFGSLTIYSGGRALFGDEAARIAVGNAVPVVLWFNFAAGIAYVIAGIGLLMRMRWAVWLAALIAAATVLLLLAFGAHIFFGGAYEMRTVGAMALRCLVWIGIAVVARRMAAETVPSLLSRRR
ncbi:MAG: hypothetical protein ABL982_25045 [Vicinamibacterales bacterium]